jgi:hypothetical protein
MTILPQPGNIIGKHFLAIANKDSPAVASNLNLKETKISTNKLGQLHPSFKIQQQQRREKLTERLRMEN